MMAADATLMSQVQRIFIRAIFADLRRRARKLGIAEPKPGGIGFTHMGGSILNLHPHFHCLLTDGVFHRGHGGEIAFAPLEPPTDEDVARVAVKVCTKVRRLLSARDTDAAVEQAALLSAQAEAVRVQPLSQLQLFELDTLDAHKEAAFEHPHKRRRRCALVEGFSVHAQSAVKGTSRNALEKLCRYGLRPSFALQRLSILDDGRVCYRLKRPWPKAGGISELVLDPLDFLKRLACLVPPPRYNLVRYWGVFASGAELRPRLARWAASAPHTAQRCSPHAPCRAVGRSAVAKGSNTVAKGSDTVATKSAPQSVSIVWLSHSAGPSAVEKPLLQRPDILTMPVDMPEHPIRPRRLPWAQLLKRTYQCDVLVCDACGGKRDIIAFIEDPRPVRKILQHVGLPAEPPPIAPARAPPDNDLLAHGIDEI
jgi:hypothetical protein